MSEIERSIARLSQYGITLEGYPADHEGFVAIAVAAEELRKVAAAHEGAVKTTHEVAVALRKVAEWEPESVDTELQGLADRLDAIGGGQ